MAEAVAASRSLSRIVFGWEAPPEPLRRLRSTYPDLEVVVASGADLIGALPGAQAAVAWQLSSAEYAAATDLVWFQTVGAGVDRVLLPEMRERGLIVTNSSGIHASNIAEHILSMMLAFARGLPQLIRAQQRREWLGTIRGHVFELDGQTLHVAGYGDIGRRLAHDAKALGMRVTATRRRPGPASDGIVDEIAGFDRLPELVADADHVAICLPQTRETIGLFDAKLIGAMKPGAYLYNIGRGPIVDTNALIAALDSGHLAGAGLDVTDPEPLPPDSPLWDRDNVIITAHTAGATPHYADRLMDIVIENVRRFRAGEPLMNRVDLDLGY